jgi:adenylosuccinate synthase
VLHHATGEYEDLRGWSEDLRECRSESDLPDAAREYLDFIQSFVGVPVVMVGVGPGRDDIVWTGPAGQLAGQVPAQAPAAS